MFVIIHQGRNDTRLETKVEGDQVSCVGKDEVIITRGDIGVAYFAHVHSVTPEDVMINTLAGAPDWGDGKGRG